MTVVFIETLVLVFPVQEAVRFLTAKDQETYNTVSGTWGSCLVTSCDSSFHEDSGACVSSTRSCTISHGEGQETYNTVSNTWGSCLVTSCDSSYHEDSGACVSDTRSCTISNGEGQETYNTVSDTWGSCLVTSCDSDYHEDSGACVSDTRSCTVSNGEGRETYNTVSRTWGSCLVTSCDSSYHEESGACVSSTRSCTISNGEGQETYNTVSDTWGACEVLSCDSSYHEESGACVSDTRSCTISHGEGQETYNTVSDTWGSCEVLSCDSSFHEDSGACVSSTRSCTISHGEGQETYNTVSDTWGSCEVLSCDSGYHEDSGACVSTFRFTELSIEGEFDEDEAPQISWSTENTDEVDHYEVSVGTALGTGDVLDWTDLSSGSSPPITLSYTPEMAHYISVRAVTSGGQVLGTITSPLGYFEASETESQDVHESVEVVLDKALPDGVIPAFALGTSVGGSDTVGWHIDFDFKGGPLRLVSGENGITFNLSEDTDYYVSMRFRHNGVDYLYSSRSFRYVSSQFRFTDLEIEGDFIDEAPQISWLAENIDEVDHYEVSVGTSLGTGDVLDWTDLSSGSSPPITLRYTPETIRYVSVRAVASGGDVLGTITSYLGYFEVSIMVHEYAEESADVLFDKALPEGVIPEFALGTSVGASDTVGWHEVSTLSGQRHRLVSGENGITFSLSEDTDYYISLRFRHNDVNYFYSSGRFRFSVLPFRFTELSILGEFGADEAPQISWYATNTNTNEVDHYEVSIGTISGASDVLDWTDLSSGSSPTITLSYTPETARYISVRAVASGGEVLDTITSYLGYFEASEDESQDAEESVEVVFDKALPEGVIPEFALGTSLETFGRANTVGWHEVPTLSGQRHRLVSGENGITFSLSEDTDYYISLRFRHNGVRYLYSSKSFYVRCDSGFHRDSGVCVSNTRSCTISNGEGQETYNTVSNTWGSCLVTSCDSDYHEDSGACVSDTRSCTISHGEGQETYNTVSNIWGSCEVLSCDSGYHEDSGACVSSTVRFTGLSILGEFGEDEAPQISWTAENTDEVDHYEVSIGTTSGASDVLDWTDLSSGSSPTITLSYTPETVRYISVRAVASDGEVLGTITSYLGYFEAIEDESQNAEESVEVVFDKDLPDGVLLEFFIGTSLARFDTVDLHTVLIPSGTRRHQVVSGENSARFTLSEDTDYYISMYFHHNGVHYSYSSRSFRFVP